MATLYLPIFLIDINRYLHVPDVARGAIRPMGNGYHQVPHCVTPLWRGTSDYEPYEEPSSMKLIGRTQSAGRLKDATSRRFCAPGRGTLIRQLS
jgi:hypothetical protein